MALTKQQLRAQKKSKQKADRRRRRREEKRAAKAAGLLDPEPDAEAGAEADGAAAAAADAAADAGAGNAKRGSKRKRGGPGAEAEAKADPDAVPKPPKDAEYPYEVDFEDHCESPGEAYADVAGLLEALAADLGKTRAELRIYDPYFCNGAVKAHLARLGFPLVHNRKEDFYAVQARGEVPEYDVLVTNPPYSGDHVERMLAFCTASRKPWLALMPAYVYCKDYYVPALKRSSSRPFYVCPSSRYSYMAPGGSTSPFVSFWYCDLLGRRASTLQRWRDGGLVPSHVQYANNSWNLPQAMKDSNDPRRRKKRKRKK